MSNSLTPWEVRNKYYQSIQLGADVRTQTEVISRQSQLLIESQVNTSNSIILSQDKVAKGILELGYGIDSVSQGMDKLGAAFEWGISEVVWQIEQNRELLADIIEILQAPLNTQAKERKKRAVDAYCNNWIDEAEEEFLESEKLNKFDFTIHISLGIIYLFKIKNKSKALEYFDKAIRYATPKSPYHASYALLHKGVIKYSDGLFNDAVQCTREAISLSPEFAEAHYQNSLYNAKIENFIESMKSLEKSILLDRKYCIKAVNDKEFCSINADIIKVIENLTQQNNLENVASFGELNIMKEGIEHIVKPVTKLSSLFEEYGLSNDFDNINKAINSMAHFDSLDAKKMIVDAKSKMRKLIVNLEKQMSDDSAKLNSSIETDKSKHETAIYVSSHRYRKLFTTAGGILGICVGFSSCKDAVRDNYRDGPIVGPIAFIVLTILGIYISKWVSKLIFRGTYYDSNKIKDNKILVRSIEKLKDDIAIFKKSYFE
ncbi:MAG: hypothetical protein A2X80_12770 [Geobacteraceae bacterium GWB2_52_12]|nr:MAG: hypothetical protein A2X80_12770 [Geobacteraceae bacterium GWB2_52_12]